MSEPSEQATKRSMLDNLKRIRQPVTWAVLVIICASQVLGIVRLTLLVFWEKTQVFAAFQEIGQSIMNLSLVIVLVALVCACAALAAPSDSRAMDTAASALRAIRFSSDVIPCGTGDFMVRTLRQAGVVPLRSFVKLCCRLRRQTVAV